MAPDLLGTRPSKTNERISDNLSDYQSSDDGYDYNVVDDAPEAQPTKPKEAELVEPRPTPAEAFASRRPDDADNAFTETMPYIFQRHAGGRRAKIPTDIDLDLEMGTNGSATINARTTQTIAPELMNIKLRWTMPEINGHHVLKMNFDKGDKEIQDPYLQRRRVRWHHSKQEVMSLDAIENLIHQCQSQAGNKNSQGLTRRLLKRVRKLAERDFVGGRFLTNLALRYDNQDVSRYTVDKTCIFFSFPYFLVANPGLRKHFGKDDPRHPTRTILQSRYRLNKTVDRDEDQCISLLGHGTTATLINGNNKRKRFWSRRVIEDLVFVPQFWGVIDGLDTLISTGPMDQNVLLGSDISITESVTRPEGFRLSLVRILFEYQNRREDLIYPVIQCDSWFGLLNKQQQILEFLETENEKPRQTEYHFWLDQKQRITISNWATLLKKSQSSEIIDIWMKKDTSKKDVPKIELHTAEGHRRPFRQPTFYTNDVQFSDDPTQIPIISPFFAWQILDEFGETDKVSIPDRVDRFLKAIYSRVAAEADIRVERKTEEQYNEYLDTIKENSVASELAQNFMTIFRLYVPVGQHSVTHPIEMYLGAAFEVIETFFENPALFPTLQKYSELVSNIVSNALRLHEGVYCSRVFQNPSTKEWAYKDEVADGAVLLAVVVDALGAILRMLVETVRALRDLDDAEDDIMGSAWKISEHGKDACLLLKEAKDQLIKEAEGRDKNGNIGPVVTPEAVTIALLDRLASGVLHNGTLDIIHLYEECLEFLALKVKYEASRRLLQRLNGFQEEVGIIKDVLVEQDNVLTNLRASLDPLTFNTPSITRKLRYKFECRAIDRILLDVRERMKNCDELITRAKSHSIQNIQLVETFQDDNSKAIFVFTIVTILFLPMSFVASFFGMNVIGISATTTTLKHFWSISLPLTFGIVIPCTFIALKGEEVNFSISRMYRRLKQLWSKDQ